LSTLFGLCCALLIESPEPMTSRVRGRSQKQDSRSLGAPIRA
jgi:hypothetical protein